MWLNLTPLQTVTCQRKSTSCLLQYANNKRNQGRFNDVTIQSNDTRISANRMVLSCYCSFFDQIFASETSNQVNDFVVNIPDVDGNSLKLLIQYIYTGQICIDSDNVFEVLAAAHPLKFDEVKEFCFEFLENCMTPDNCITILIKAKQYKNFTLRDKVYKYISDNYKTIIKTPAFLNLDYNELFFIVYHLKTRFFVNDEVLCRSLLRWTKQDEETRKQHFHDRLIKFVNVGHFSTWLVKDLLKESLIQENAEYYNLLNEKMINLKAKQTVIISIGGSELKTKVKVVYSLLDKVYKTYPDLPIALDFHCSIKTNEFVYVIGGIDIDNQIESNKVFRLNLSKKVLKWEEIASMNEKRRNHGVAVFDGAIVVCGGYNGSKHLSSAEAYNVTLNQWINVKPLNQGRTGIQSVTSGGCLYTLGGWENKNSFSMERLDGLDQSWKSVSSMQTERSSFAAVSCDDVIYAIGGCSSSISNFAVSFAFAMLGPGSSYYALDVFKSVEKYDCATDKWSYVSELNIGRCKHSACIMQGKIFVVGGLNAEGKLVKEIECYDSSTDKWEIVARIDNKFVAHSLIVV